MKQENTNNPLGSLYNYLKGIKPTLKGELSSIKKPFLDKTSARCDDM